MPLQEWSVPLARLCEALFVVSFVWLALAIGRRTLRLLGVDQKGSLLERGVVGLALGAGMLQFPTIALGALHLLSPSSLRWTLLAITAVMSPDMISVAKSAARLVAARSPAEPWVRWLLFALTPMVFVAALIALTPTLDPDGLAYHLTIPKRWLAAGYLEYLPTYPVANTPLAGEMLFSIALVFADDVAAKLLHLVLGLTGGFGLYLAGTRLGGRVAGAIAAALFLVGPAGAGTLLGAAYVEGLTTLPMIAALLTWQFWLEDRNTGWLRCTGLLAGFGVSFKLTAGLFPVGLGILTLFVLWDDVREKRVARLQVMPLVTLGAIALLPVMPWLVRSALLTGNPVYPLFANHIPSRDLSPALSKTYSDFNRYNNWGSSIGSHWSMARRKLILAGAAGGFVVAGAVVIASLRTRLQRATGAVVVLVMLLQLGAAGLYVRYWVPILAVLQLPIALFLAPRLPARFAPYLVVGATALGALVHARRGAYAASGLLATSLGLEDRRTYLLSNMPHLPVYERANQLPPDAHVILSCSCNGFYIDRTTYCIEFLQEGLRSTNWPEFVSDLRRLGATHMVAPRSLAAGGPGPPLEYSSSSVLIREKEYELVSRLLMGYGELLEAAGDQGLYRLDVARIPFSPEEATPRGAPGTRLTSDGAP